MVTGTGLSPFGTSPAGYGIPTEEDIPERIVFADDNGQQQNSRYIDPETRDYRFNSSGYIVGAPGLAQKVYLALLTVKGTSVFKSLGQEFSTIKVISDSIAERIDLLVRKALRRLVDLNQIRISSVSVDRKGSKLVISVSWIDVAKQEENLTRI